MSPLTCLLSTVQGYCSCRLVAFEASHGSSSGPVDKPVYAIAARLGIKPEQVLLAWVRSKGAIVLR